MEISNMDIIDGLHLALDDACRCRKCGQVMLLHHGKEWHDEVQDYESYVEAYCPHCDIAEEDM